MANVVIEMTPFLFEDGNTYYFQIFEFTNSYHALYVYEKKVKTVGWIFKEEVEEYLQIGDKELVDIKLDTAEIKIDIIKILTAKKAHKKLINWDGIVGNIPEDVKVALKRESKLNDLFK
jgi:hypothetical protein